MNKTINIIIVGVNYHGQMVSSQRVKNLFSQISYNSNVKISNIVINANDEEQEKILESHKIIKYNFWNPISILVFFYKGLFYISKKFNRKALNIIYHYGYPSLEDILFLKFAKILGYKIVYDIVESISHTSSINSSLRLKIKNWSSRQMLNQLHKNGSLCFGISSGLCKILNIICVNKISVVHLPICIDVDYVSSFKKEKGVVSEKKIKMFYGGSFGFKDGFEFLINGFELACERQENIELILTGKISKQMDGKVQSLIASSKFSQRIKFLGCLSSSEYYSTMVNSDILCMTRINSEYANLGFPFKLGEYLASGNAIIATRVGDVPNYINHKQNAVLINPESASEICDAIIELANNPQLREDLSLNARITALKFFSSEKWSNFFYNKLLILDNV